MEPKTAAAVPAAAPVQAAAQYDLLLVIIYTLFYTRGC